MDLLLFLLLFLPQTHAAARAPQNRMLLRAAAVQRLGKSSAWARALVPMCLSRFLQGKTLARDTDDEDGSAGNPAFPALFDIHERDVAEIACQTGVTLPNHALACQVATDSEAAFAFAFTLRCHERLVAHYDCVRATAGLLAPAQGNEDSSVSTSLALATREDAVSFEVMAPAAAKQAALGNMLRARVDLGIASLFFFAWMRARTPLVKSDRVRITDEDIAGQSGFLLAIGTAFARIQLDGRRRIVLVDKHLVEHTGDSDLPTARNGHSRPRRRS